MKVNNRPRQLAVSFAEKGDKNPIPDNTNQKIKEEGNATWETGFPPLTMTPIAAGGIPPHGKDMNGIIHELSAAVRFAQAGGLYPFSRAFADVIGGYPKGALLTSTDGVKIWWNAADENTTDPDSAEAKGWKSLLTDPNGLFLHKTQNLADLQNKAEGRKHLEVYSRSETDRQFADARNNFAAKMGVNRTITGKSGPSSPGVWSVENSEFTPEKWGTLLYTTNGSDLSAGVGNGQFHHYLFLSHSRKLWVATNVNGNWGGWQEQLDARGGKVTGEIQSTSPDNYRIVAGDYGTFWRNDGNSLYLLLTKAEDPYGTWNNLRPFTVDVKTGQVTLANTTIAGDLKVGISTHAQDGNIWGSRWGNKWLWDAVIEQVNGRVDWGTFTREVGARATTDYVNNRTHWWTDGERGWWKDENTGFIYQWTVGPWRKEDEQIDTVGFPMRFPNQCCTVNVGAQSQGSGNRNDATAVVYGWNNENCQVQMNVPGESSWWNPMRTIIFAIGR